MWQKNVVANIFIGFFILLMFIDIDKYGDINKYVQGDIKDGNNIT